MKVAGRSGASSSSSSGRIRPGLAVPARLAGVAHRHVVADLVPGEEGGAGHAGGPEDVVGDVGGEGLAGDPGDDRPQHDVAGVRVAAPGSRLEQQRLGGEQRKVVPVGAQVGLVGVEERRSEDVAETRRVIEEPGDGDPAPRLRVRVVREQVEDRVVEGELAGFPELADRHLGQLLVDRAEVEPGAHPVGDAPVPVGRAVGALEDRLAVERQQHRAGEAVGGGQVPEVLIQGGPGRVSEPGGGARRRRQGGRLRQVARRRRRDVDSQPRDPVRRVEHQLEAHRVVQPLGGDMDDDPVVALRLDAVDLDLPQVLHHPSEELPPVGLGPLGEPRRRGVVPEEGDQHRRIAAVERVDEAPDQVRPRSVRRRPGRQGRRRRAEQDQRDQLDQPDQRDQPDQPDQLDQGDELGEAAERPAGGGSRSGAVRSEHWRNLLGRVVSRSAAGGDRRRRS